MTTQLLTAIKTNIAQATDVFSDTQQITAKVISNRIYDTGLSGEYTLSGAIHSSVSNGCINNTYVFDGGETEADCFLGDTETSISCTAHTVNIGTAVSRAKALEIMENGSDPIIIIYQESVTGLNKNVKHSLSQDLTLKVKCTLGVMYRIPLASMSNCDSLDEVLISSVLGIVGECGAMLQFDKVNDRFIFGTNYVFDISLSYEKNIDINAIIQNRAKAFENNGFIIKQGE